MITRSGTTRGAAGLGHLLRMLIGIVAILCMSLPAAVYAAGADSGRTAIARHSMEWGKDGKPAKLDFDFRDFKAWGRRDGSWHIEGVVQHNGLRCGTYTLSLRIGHGNPGCTGVQWFGEPRSVASTTLCNNAMGNLSSGDLQFAEASRLDEITCAERIISCTGTCK